MVATLSTCSDGLIGGGQRDALTMGEAPIYDSNNTSPGAFARTKGMNLRITYAELAPLGGGGGGGGGGDPTVASLAAYRTTYGVAASRPAGNYARITPGSAETSAIPILAGRRDPIDTYAQMPPGLSHVVDESGIASLRNWINALK